mmetsp:Transcript_24647/g.39055  ORF Transcript_24647/g.39055 Transcript_24647/m.39055 type:complete len:588 (+) Transcript_24647:303-2066(+)
MPPPPPRLRVEVLVLLLGSGGRGAPRAAGRATLGEGEGGQRAAGPRDLAARLLQRLREGGVLLQVPVGHGAARVAHGRLEVPGQDLGHGVLLLHVLHVLAGLRAQPLALHVAHDVLADGQLGRPLADLRQVRPGELLRLGRQVAQVHVLVHGGLAQRGLQDADARLQVGHGDVDQLVQPAGAHERRVDDVRPVGGPDDEHVLLGAHAVHLGQQLVHHAVTGPAAVARAAAALLRDRVQLVEEEHAGRGRARLGEHVAHVALGLAEPHGQQLGALHGDEVRLALVGHRLGHQGLAAAGRPVEEHALRGAHAELLKLVRVLHRVLHQLLQLALHVHQAANVVPAHVGHLHRGLSEGGRVGHAQREPEVLHVHGHRVQHLRVDVVLLDINEIHLLTDALHGSFCAQRSHIRTNKAMCLVGNLLGVHVVVQLHVTRVDAEDLQAAVLVRHADVDLAVEPPEAAEGRIDRVGAVGCADDHHIGPALQPIHQGEQLGDDTALDLAVGLVALRRDGIDLINEDDGRGVFLRLLKSLAQIGLRFTSHLTHDLWAVDEEEEGPGFVGDSSGYEGFTRTRRTIQEYTTWGLHAQSLE